ncbi:MAG: TonB-dependent receptor [Candidatus Kapabacteria bacterium]|nr:TonB-dependent receptor [Candidatus Kapabacteria bacterium]
MTFVSSVVLLSGISPASAAAVGGMMSDTTRRDTTEYSMKPVTVIAQASRLDSRRAPFTMSVIQAADIMRQPIRAVSDALMYVPGVDLRQRGPLGVQSDVSIRGGTFEQTAVMINGMRLNDVQTGHNTFSIPVLPTDVERIEVIKGGAARALGSGAMDGAVNIVLKEPSATPTVHASIMGGDAAFYEGRLSASLATGSVSHRVSAQWMRHDGWVPSTDVDMKTAMYHGGFMTELVRASAFVGLSTKSFGANGFYTPRFPDQWERVSTMIAGASVESSLSDVLSCTIRALARRNDDEFRLKRNDPGFYTNIHHASQYTGQGLVTLEHASGLTSFLVEAGSDAIQSSNLGTHDRLRGSMVVEHSHVFDALQITIGGGVLVNSDRRPLPTGGVDASYTISSDTPVYELVFGSLQTNGRIPTYTDLYYRDPVTTGNSQLDLERAVTAEIGYRRSASQSVLNLALYARNSRNMIDYVIDSLGNARAENITSVSIQGLDVSYNVQIASRWLSSVRIGLVYQSVRNSAPSRTRYTADNLRLQGIVDTQWQLPFDVVGSYMARVVERVTNPTYYLVHDVRLMRTIGAVTVTAEVTNITNQQYIETGWVRIAPRWGRLGAAVQL